MNKDAFRRTTQLSVPWAAPQTLIAKTTFGYGCDCPPFALAADGSAFFYPTFADGVVNAATYRAQFGRFVLQAHYGGVRQTRQQWLGATGRAPEGDMYWSDDPQPVLKVDSWCYQQGSVSSFTRETEKAMWATGVAWCVLASSSSAPLKPPRPNQPDADMAALTGGPLIARPSTSQNQADNDDEHPPANSVILPFKIDRHEVTVADYTKCMRAGACSVPNMLGVDCNSGKPGRANHPINCVSWYQAQAYCTWAGKRLPSEDEWEFAARGTTGRFYPWGDSEPTHGQVCFEETTCNVNDHKKGMSPERVAGLAGNVWEWTASAYCCDRNDHCESDARVIRGGGFRDNPEQVRGAIRTFRLLAYRSDNLGLRCAR